MGVCIGVGANEDFKVVGPSVFKGFVKMREVFLNVAVNGEDKNAGKIRALEPEDSGNVPVTNGRDGPGEEVVRVQDGRTAAFVKVIGLVAGTVNNAIFVEVWFLK